MLEQSVVLTPVDGDGWEKRRHHLGVTDSWGRSLTRKQIGKLLGLGTKTIERYELHGKAPAWYQLALVGLGEHLKNRTRQLAG